MPRENKKRGKRGDKKRKHEDVDDVQLAHHADEAVDGPNKRMRVHDDEQTDSFAQNVDHAMFDNRHEPSQQHVEDDAYAGKMSERPFYGMLDEDEQEYFKKADDMLELNDFATPEERTLFLENVFKEADGKELKMACSQSCSRLMERLIAAASTAQLSRLFQKFNGNFLHLVQHRFASHCCEKLFARAAPLVTKELLHKSDPAIEVDSNEVYVPFEQLFLHTIAEVEGDIGFLMTDRSASHALRILLLILAGEPLDSSTNKALLASKKKEGTLTNGTHDDSDKLSHKTRTVPKSFTTALETLMVKGVAGLNTTGLRALALHPVGSPILQVLLRLELTHFGKARTKDETSIFRTLLPEDPITQETESAGFINGLNYDPVGSHLLEVLIEHTPGKMFKNLYKEFWKDRMASLSRNDIACFVVCKILERISRDDLVDAHELIVPVIPDLIERNRVIVLKTLMQRCAVRNVDTQALAVALDAHFAGADGFDVLKLLHIDRKDLEDKHAAREGATGDPAVDQVQPAPSKPAVEKVQGSVLAQTMILVPGPLSALVFDSMPAIPVAVLLEMASDPIHSRTIQAAMTSTNASIIPRRKLVQQFYGHIGELSLDGAGSHVVDAIWEGTHGLAFIRERIAEELAENEAALRESMCGRAVWKNWKMDLYKRRRHEWVLQSRNKASDDGFQSFAELDKNKDKMEDGAKGRVAQDTSATRAALGSALGAVIGPDSKTSPLETAARNEQKEKQKTPLDRARERHAAKARNSRERESRSRRTRTTGTASAVAGKTPATGANAAAAAVV